MVPGPGLNVCAQSNHASAERHGSSEYSSGKGRHSHYTSAALLDGFAPSSHGPCSSCFGAAVFVVVAAVAAGKLPVELAERAVGSETRGSSKAGRLGREGYESWA